MSSRVRGRVAFVLGMVAVLAFAPAGAVHAEDDEASDDEQSQPVPGSHDRGTFGKNSVSPGDIDPLFQSGPGGERDHRVGVILAAHPDRDVLICLAGCGGGGPKLVAVRNRPAVVVAAAVPAQRELKPASTTMVAPGSATISEQAQPAVGDVICIAGCAGAPGEVVQQGVRLTWIGQGASEDLKSALRGLANRLMAREVEAQAAQARDGLAARQAWVSDHARRMLVEPSLPAVLAALVRSASAVAGRGRVDLR